MKKLLHRIQKFYHKKPLFSIMILGAVVYLITIHFCPESQVAPFVEVTYLLSEINHALKGA